MDDFVGKWVQIKDSHVNFDGMIKVMKVPAELAEKIKNPYSVEYKKEGDILSAHFVLKDLGEKTYREKPDVENIIDGMDGKKYKAKYEIKDKLIKETSTAVDGGPELVIERRLEGNDTMVVEGCAAGVKFGYKMLRQ